MKFLILLFVVVGCSGRLTLFQSKLRAPSTCESKVTHCCWGDDCDFDCETTFMERNFDYSDFVKFGNDHFIRSIEYLFLSAQFGTHSKDRPGFEKILYELADSSWEKGVEIMKQTTRRGVKHSISDINSETVRPHGDLNEVEALAKALTIEMKLLDAANDLHRMHSHGSLSNEHSKQYDASLTSYLEQNVIEEKTETVRQLIGHVNELKNLFKQDASTFRMSLYLYDQYLQK